MNLPGLTLLVLVLVACKLCLIKGAIWIGSTRYNNNINSSISYFSDLFSHLGSTSENPILDLSLFKSRNFTMVL